MKRAYPQKVKPVSSHAVDEAMTKFSACNLGLFWQASPEGNRRVCTSAAMIGLAISMGASSLFLPRQGDKALAVEPIKFEPSTKTAASLSEHTALLPNAPIVPNEAQAAQHLNGLSPQSGREELSLWSLSEANRVSVDTLSSEVVLRTTPSIEVDSETKALTIHPETVAVETLATEAAESRAEAPVQLGEEKANSFAEHFKAQQSELKAKQDISISEFKPSTNRLNNSLAEWRSEESVSSQASGVEPASSIEESAVYPLVIPAQSETVKVPNPVFEPSPTRNASSLPNPEVSSEWMPVAPKASESVYPTIVPSSQASGSEFVPVVPEPQNTTPESARSTEANISPTSIDTVAEPDMSQAVIIPAQESEEISRIHRVNPGETLDTIARNYGVDQAELVKANHLNDPNLINVDQTLKVPIEKVENPVQPTLRVLPNSEVSPEAEYKPVPSPELVIGQTEQIVPNVVLPQTQADESTTIPLSVVPFKPEPAASKELVEKEVNASVLPEISPEAPQEASSAESPYVERLRAEINLLREKARTQKTETQEQFVPVNATTEIQKSVVPSLLGEPTNSQPARSTLNISARTKVVNPEFSPSRYTESLKPSTVSVKPATESVSVQETSMASVGSPDEAQVVATAPIGVQGYEQGIQPRMVSPDLPPLAPADTYLPKGVTFEGYIWPAKGVLTSGYGWRWGRMHRGIDIAGPIGTPIVAAAPGVVTYAGWNDGGYGNLVEITHEDGSTTLYAHNDRVLVREGQFVDQGQQVSEMGSTGFSTGPHLHFEVHPKGSGAVDPIALLPR